MIAGILKLIGFGAAGVIKGSIAASKQSFYGFVKVGIWFAKLTSIAMRAT